jgi:lipopolysaccharide transport system permease protein
MKQLMQNHPARAFAALWRNRFLIEQLVRKELSSKYRKSSLGAAWIILNPLLLVGAYTLVFGVLLGVRWGGAGSTLEFALVLHAGVMFFMFFNEIMSRSTTLVASNQSYVTKMVFPTEVFPVVITLVAGVSFVATLLIWTVLSVAIRGEFPVGIIWIPFVFFPFLMFCLGLSWFLSALAVFKPDVEHAMPMTLLVLMYLSPLLFPAERMPEAFRWVIAFNPLSWVLEPARSALIHNVAPDIVVVGVGSIVSLVVFWVGYASFKGNQRNFANVL